MRPLSARCSFACNIAKTCPRVHWLGGPSANLGSTILTALVVGCKTQCRALLKATCFRLPNRTPYPRFLPGSPILATKQLITQVGRPRLPLRLCLVVRMTCLRRSLKRDKWYNLGSSGTRLLRRHIGSSSSLKRHIEVLTVE